MSRGALPTYTRLSHIPNILEAYRYITRRNLTVLASELQMSYHTVRRLCVEYSTPRNSTLTIINNALNFINQDTWEHWKLLCESALKAEQTGDVVTLTQVENKLRDLVPEQEGVLPIHLLHECSIEAASLLHTATLTNKTFSFYLSDLHSDAMDLLSIKRGVTKSELLRIMIDEALVTNPDVMEALVNTITGAPAKVIAPPQPVPPEPEEDIVTITSKEELAKLVPNIPVEEVVAQITTDLPDDLEEDEIYVEVDETVELISEPVDFSTEDESVHFEEWSPAVTMDSDSNLSEEEIAKLFSGEQ